MTFSSLGPKEEDFKKKLLVEWMGGGKDVRGAGNAWVQGRRWARPRDPCGCWRSFLKDYRGEAGWKRSWADVVERPECWVQTIPRVGGWYALGRRAFPLCADLPVSARWVLYYDSTPIPSTQRSNIKPALYHFVAPSPDLWASYTAFLTSHSNRVAWGLLLFLC